MMTVTMMTALVVGDDLSIDHDGRGHHEDDDQDWKDWNLGTLHCGLICQYIIIRNK